MVFFNHRHEHLSQNGTTVGVPGDNQDEAISMAQRIWDGLLVDETALGYSLFDTKSGQFFYTQVR